MNMKRLKMRIVNKIRDWRGLPILKEDGTPLTPHDIVRSALKVLHERAEGRPIHSMPPETRRRLFN